MEQVVWRTAPGGLLVSSLGECRLFVEQVNGWVRYQVHRRGEVTETGSSILLASGNRESVRAAMDAAERAARPADAGRRWPAGEQAA